MKPIIPALLLTTLGMAQVRAQTTLSVEEAVQRGLARSAMLMASSQRAEAASALSRETRTTLLPSVALESGYRRLSDVDPFQVTVPFSPSPIVISPIVLDNYTVRLSLQQPLFTGFRLASHVRAAEFTAEASRFEYRADQADLVLQVRSSYWMLYQTIEVERFIEENVARLEAHGRDTERLMKAGLATRNDLLKIRVQLLNARLSRIDASHDVQLAMMDLNMLLGLPPDTPLNLTSQPQMHWNLRDIVPGADTSAQRLVGTALTRRAELRSVESRIRAGEAAVTAVRGNWWPQLFLTGNYFYSRPNARYLPTRNEFKPSWDVGIQLQFHVWNWGATGYQVDRARAQLLETEYLFRQMKDNVTVDVNRTLLGVRRAHQKIGVAAVAVEEAQENLRSTEEKYRNGLATSSDLLDAEVAAVQARTNFTGALVAYEISRAALQRALGTEEHTGRE